MLHQVLSWGRNPVLVGFFRQQRKKESRSVTQQLSICCVIQSSLPEIKYISILEKCITSFCFLNKKRKQSFQIFSSNKLFVVKSVYFLYRQCLSESHLLDSLFLRGAGTLDPHHSHHVPAGPLEDLAERP